VVRANVAAVTADVTGAINVGTGIETNVNQLYATLAKAAGSDTLPTYAAARPGEQSRSVIAALRAKRELGWEPQVTIGEGLHRTYQFFKERDAQRG
jgi:UDP-glucose 4-epimerase